MHEFSFTHLFISPPELHSQVLEAKVVGVGSAWGPVGLERRVGAYGGLHPRPRAFSQSAVHALERREREGDLEKVWWSGSKGWRESRL